MANRTKVVCTLGGEGGGAASADYFVGIFDRYAAVVSPQVKTRERLAATGDATWNEMRLQTVHRVLQMVDHHALAGARLWFPVSFGDCLAQVKGERKVTLPHLKGILSDVVTLLRRLRKRHACTLGTMHAHGSAGMGAAVDLAKNLTTSPHPTPLGKAAHLLLRGSLSRFGYRIRECGGAGDCQFRAVAHLV